MAENSVIALHRFGQSPWLDFIDRALIEGGALAKMMRRWGLRGLTSNPSIFEKAIGHGSAYDDAIVRLAGLGLDREGIYESLVLEDVALAADLFLPIYEESGAEDGYVSLEVSPLIANDTPATISEARRLSALVARPNLMIKVPATPAGIAAVSVLFAEGISVNVTLIFGLEQYKAAVQAHLTGLEGAASAGLPIQRIASVASFFLSRIDAMADPLLVDIASQGGASSARAASLQGRIAIASANCAYAHLRETLSSSRFERLARLGAMPQRLLWASTGNKNPEYSETKYVEPLIGPHTVSTLPTATLEAYEEQGHPALRLGVNPGRAPYEVEALRVIGIDLNALTEALLDDGIAKFVSSFNALRDRIECKRRAFLAQSQASI
jgi:transaldolase